MAKKKKKEIETGRILGRINDDGSITPFIQKQQEEEIAPVKDTWLKKGALNDSGYAIQNPLDAINRFNASILMTGVDALGQFGKGFLGSAEGVSDIAKTTTADVLDFFGADNKAKKLRKSAEKTWGINEELDKSLIDDNGFGIDDMSLLGQKGKSVPQGLGTTMFSMTTGSVLGGAGGMALLGLSAAGNSEQEAIKEMKANQDINGFSDKEIYKNAKLYGLLSGTAEAATEMMFGAAAQGSNLLGIGTGAFDSADDAVINALTKKISNKLVKTFTQAGLKASSEGIEEVASGMLDALAKKITYQKDKKYWTELLKDENLLDSFLSGTFSAALSQAPSVARNVTTTENGKVRLRNNNEIRDFLTNLNEQEQQVVEREVENRVNQEEKVTKKRRAEIQKQVIEDLDRGYINANTIRDVLGENYNAERDVRLNESFNEETRRTQAYENDLSKYDEKQRKTIQKAIDSGLLNNSNKTHDFVDLIAKLSADKGIDFDFTNNERIKESGFAIDGKQVNGFIKDGKIALNLESNQVLNKTVGHEITHVLEGTELYNSLQDSLKSFIGEREWNNRISELEKTYKDVKGANIENELTSDLVGEYVFNDESFVKSLSTKNPNLFQKIFDEIKYMVKIATAGSKEARDLEKVKRAFEKAYRETSKTQEGTQYSIKESKQMLEKQFKELTGDSLLRAEGKLGLYAFQQMNNIQAEAPYNEEAMKLFNAIQNSKKTSSHLYHSTPADRIQSIVQNGLQVGSEQNQEGVSSTDKLYLSATEELADSFTPNDSVTLRISPNANLENLDNDLLGGEGSYTITNNIDPKYLQVKENGKWVNLLKSQYAKQDVKYSLTTDNQGRQLSEQQQEFFKDSKVRDDEGNLKEVYHRTYRGGFNVFENKKGIHFFTDDADASYYGDNRYNVYLNITNPLVIDGEGKNYNQIEFAADGLDQYNSTSIKSVVDNIDIATKEDIINLAQAIDSNNSLRDYIDEFNTPKEMLDSVIEAYDEGATLEQFVKDYGGLSMFTENDNIPSTKVTNTQDITEYAKANGYDGVIFNNIQDKTNGAATVYATFESNQIKNVDNTNPTSNPDIRYSLSPAGEMVDNNGNKVTLEASEEGNSGTLMVLHNLGEDKFNGVLDLGGIPVPSLAVTNPNIIDHNQFGEGTLIFDKSTIDPAVEANEVYDRDVWSPTIRDNVQIDYEINDDAIETTAEKLGIEAWRLRDAVEDNKPEYLAERLLREEKLIDKYVKDNNIKYETAYKDAETKVDMHQSGENLRKFIRDNDLTVEKISKDRELRQKYFDEIKKYYDESSFPQAVKENLYKEKMEYFDKWIDERTDIRSREDIPRGLLRYQDDFDLIKSGDNKVVDEWQTEKNKKQAAIDNGIEEYLKQQTKDVYGEKGIRNDVELFTNSGNRRSFWALHDEYNLDNLVEALTKGETTGTQHFGSGYGQIQAAMANRFNSISDIKANESLLTNLSENNEVLENAKANIDSDIEEIESNNDVYYDTVAELLVDFARGDLTIDNFKKLTRNDYQTIRNVSDSLIEKIIDDMETLKNLPTDYFEAKPQRALGLDEIQMAVIPNNWSAETKQRLTDMGIQYTEYDPSIEGDRQRVINQFDDLKFSLSQNNIAPTSGWNVRSEDVRLQSAFQDTIAPLQEQVQQLTDTITRLEDKIAPIKEEREDIETRSEGFVIDKINDLLWRLQGKKDRYFGLTKPDMELLRNTVLEDRQNRTEYLNDFINNLTQKIVDNSNADVNVNEIKEELSSNINDYLDEYRALTEQEADELYQETQRGFENEPAPIRENLTPEENQRMDMLELLERNNMMNDERRYEKEQLENKINPVYPTEEATPGQALSDIRDVNEVGSPKIKAYQYEHPEVKPYFREEARGMLSDLRNSQKGGRYIYESQERGQGTNYDVLANKRFTSPEIAELLDSKWGYTYDDIEKGLNAIIEDHGAENIAIAKRIELVLDDNLRNGYTDWQTGMEVPPNQQYLNMLAEQEWQNYFDDINSQYPLEQLQEPQYNPEDEETDFSDVKIDKDIQDMTVDDLNLEPFLQGLVKADERQKARQEIAKEVGNRKEYTPKKKGLIGKAIDLYKSLTNEFAVVDEFAKDVKNPTITHKIDTWNNYVPLAQTNITTAQTDINGKAIGRSWNSIWEEANKLGIAEKLDEYVKHWSNIDRGKRGKGALDYSAKESYKKAQEIKSQYPDVHRLAKDIWQFSRNERHNLRDAGTISQQVSDILGSTNPHYIPFVSDNISNYFTETGELKPRRTIKRAKGGAELEGLLSVEEAMKSYIYSQFDEATGNRAFLEIVKSSPNQFVLGGDDRTSYVNQDHLSVDKDGYYLTAYENGEPITARISKEMYDSLSRQTKHRVDEFVNKYESILKPIEKFGNLRRKMLTELSPSFLLKNPGKDFQEAVINSKYTKDMIANYMNPQTWIELANGTGEADIFRNNYGSGLVMGQYDIDISEIDPKSKNFNFLKKLGNANEYMELITRYAEFKASRQNGASIQEAMYNAREVTTNFSRGNPIVKAFNKYGMTFLNSSVQGFDKFIRNFSGENGAKGIVNSLAKAAIFGIAPAVFNELAFGSGDDKDEEYEALPDYIKDNYYIIKTGDGNFIRIPKGRVLSVFGSAARRTIEAMEGEENAFEGYWNNVQQQIGVNNPEENNIFAPLIQAMGGRKLDSGQTAGSAWYGGDIIPTRLQKEHPEDQHDASIDKFSIWLGQKTGISPYKINYVLDQYSGGIGDLALPMFTEEANSDADNVLEFISSGIKDQFKVDTITDNKYVSEFYDTYNKLYSGSKKNDEDVLKENYMTNISKQMGELYAERREIQADTTLSKKEKYEKAQTIKAEINRLAKEGLDNYENISITGDYADVDGQEYQRTDDGWRKLSSNTSDEVNSLGLTNREKNNYIKTQKDISSIKKKYKDTDDYVGKKQDIIGEIINTNLTDDAKMSLYQDTYKDKFSNYATDLGFDADTYLEYKAQDFSADKDKNGKSISGSKKRKVFDYVNSLDIPYEQKLLLAKSEYNSFNDNNYEIIEYIENSGMDYDERIELYKTLGFKVDGDSISW